MKLNSFLLSVLFLGIFTLSSGMASELMDAIAAKNPSKVKELLEKGDATTTINFKETDPNTGDTLLMQAIRTGKKEILDLVLTRDEIKQSLTVKNDKRFGRNALMYALEIKDEAMAKALLNVKATNPTNEKAIEKQKIEQLKVRNDSQNTPMLRAIHNGQEGVVKEMLQKFPDVDFFQENKWGSTAILWATRKGYTEIAKELIERDKKRDKKKWVFDKQNKFGSTPLMWAIRKENGDLAKYLVDQGADLDKKHIKTDSSLPDSADDIIGKSAREMAEIKKEKLGSGPLAEIFGDMCKFKTPDTHEKLNHDLLAIFNALETDKLAINNKKSFNVDRESDPQFLKQLLARLMECHLPAPPAKKVPDDLLELKTQIKGLMDQPGGDLITLIQGKTVLGLMTCVEKLDDEGKKVVELADVCIGKHEKTRRKGLGTQLIQQGMEECKKEGRNFSIKVPEENKAARNFLTSRGGFIPGKTITLSGSGSTGKKFIVMSKEGPKGTSPRGPDPSPEREEEKEDGRGGGGVDTHLGSFTGLPSWDRKSKECQDWQAAQLLACGPQDYLAAKELLEKATFVNSSDMFNNIGTHVNKALESSEILDDDPIIIHMATGKSTEWIPKELFAEANKSKFPKLFNGKREVVWVADDGNSADKLNGVLKDKKYKHVLRIDDAIYSGQQMGDFANKMADGLSGDKRNLFIISDRSTKYGADVVSGVESKRPGKLNIKLFSNPMKTMEEEFDATTKAQFLKMYNQGPQDLKTKASLFYGHKVPDNVSTISSFFRTGYVQCSGTGGSTRVQCDGSDLSFECVPMIIPPNKNKEDFLKAHDTNPIGKCNLESPKTSHCQKVLAAREKFLSGKCGSTNAPLLSKTGTEIAGQKDAQGNTILHLAAKEGYPGLFDYLNIKYPELGPVKNLASEKASDLRKITSSTTEYNNVFAALQRIKEAFKKVSDPSEMAVVLDVDDTLIIPARPGMGPLRERPGAKELLQFLKDNKIPFVISSAHGNFDETVDKLKAIGALELAGITDPSTKPEAVKNFSIKGNKFEKQVKGFRQGNVASAMKADGKKVSGEFYSEKVASVNFVLSPEQRSKIKTLLFVDDSSANHKYFIKDIDQTAAQQFQNLKTVDTIRLKKTRDDSGEVSHLYAGRKKIMESGLEESQKADVESLYMESYHRVGPMMIGAVDDFLRSRKDKDNQFIFMARDGIGGFEIAKILLKKYPDRYKPITPDKLHYLYINRDTANSPLLGDYLAQEGVQKTQSAHFFDIGWNGSMANNLQKAIVGKGSSFGGLYMLCNAGNNPLATGFIQHTQGDDKPPFYKVSGARAVHFMEDTFGERRVRPFEFFKQKDGVITPVLGKGNTDPLDQTHKTSPTKEKKDFALRAIIDAARDLPESSLDELQSMTPEGTKAILYPLLDKLNGGKAEDIKIMVPHEK